MPKPPECSSANRVVLLFCLGNETVPSNRCCKQAGEGTISHVIILSKRILGGIRQRLRLVIGNVFDSQQLEHLKQRLAAMRERHRPMMRIALFN